MSAVSRDGGRPVRSHPNANYRIEFMSAGDEAAAAEDRPGLCATARCGRWPGCAGWCKPLARQRVETSQSASGVLAGGYQRKRS